MTCLQTILLSSISNLKDSSSSKAKADWRKLNHEACVVTCHIEKDKNEFQNLYTSSHPSQISEVTDTISAGYDSCLHMRIDVVLCMDYLIFEPGLHKKSIDVLIWW